MSPTPSFQVALNWKTADINSEFREDLIDWDNLRDYAIRIKKERTASDDTGVTCDLSLDYNVGGVHVVRRVEFGDGSSWVVRLQMHQTTPESCQRMLQEVHTTSAIRKVSNIPTPEVFAYEANNSNPVGVLFMLMELIPANTGMDSFGGYDVHKGESPAQFKDRFHKSMAAMQVELSSVRFSKIGTINRTTDGQYTAGPILKIGGPFNTAAGFFKAWAKATKFRYDEAFIRKSTPPEYCDAIIASIKNYPAKLTAFAETHPFREGPFPVVHPDLYISNVLINPVYDVLGVIDWENAFATPWEMVEFIKDLFFVPPLMDGPLHREETIRQTVKDRKLYVDYLRKMENEKALDQKLSTTLGDWKSQIWPRQAGFFRVGGLGSIVRI